MILPYDCTLSNQGYGFLKSLAVVIIKSSLTMLTFLCVCFFAAMCTVHHPARVTVVNLAKMAETVAPLREVLYELMAFIHRICRQYFVC